MKKLLTLAIYLVAFQFVFSQDYSYYTKGPYCMGKDRGEVKKMLFVNINRHSYTAQWIESDSTIEVEIKNDSASWVIYCAFYFDSTSTCYSYTIERCDILAGVYINELLKDKEYLWRKIDIDKYISDFYHCELLEVRHDDDKCAIYKRTKLNLTRKQYKELKRTKKD
jgi:hypothetical protein